MRLAYRLELADLLAARTWLANRRAGHGRGEVIRFLVCMAVGYVVVISWQHLYRPSANQMFMIAAVLGILLASWVATLIWARRPGLMAAWLEKRAGEYELTSSLEGLSVRSGDKGGFFAWRHVLALEETDAHWLVHVGRGSAIPVPKAAMTPAMLDDMRRQWAMCPEHYGASLPSHPPVWSLSAWLRRNFWKNLQGGVLLAGWRPVTTRHFQTGMSALLVLLSLEFGIALLFDYQNALPQPEFNIFGVGEFAFNFLLFLLGASVVAAMMAHKAIFARLLTMLLSGLVVVDIVYVLLYIGLTRIGPASYLAWLYPALYFAAIFWILAIAYRVMRLFGGLPVPFAGMMASVFLLIGVMFPSAYFPQQELFYPTDEQQDMYSKTADLDVESIYYRQPHLVDETLQHLLPETPGRPDLYFVGVAGQAEEKVFANEVDYVHKLFDSRFGTAGHSLALVNSLNTLDRLPLANAHNLGQALRGLGERMNRDEDILFMYLTSHGSKDFKLSISFWPLGLQDLPAARLKQLLDESGIRNRVIVVSACYSGGFVDALKDEHTVVMTAASRDRTSFGCGSTSDFTYFGEAYFVQSLSKGMSFIDAFNRAKVLIEKRERTEGKEPSQPQLFVGSAMREKLKVLESAMPL